MNFPSDAPQLDITGTKTVRVTSVHSGNTFSAVFMFEDESFYKFKVRLDGVITSTKDDLFKFITSGSLSPYIDIDCIGMDSSGCIVANLFT